ncbi:MAG TPA: amidase, partial [Stellaceae bacterium]
MDPTQLTIAEASRSIAAGELSPVALTQAYLDRIAALDGELHSYVLVLREAALAAARQAATSRTGGVLHGIPIGLKDIYKTRGVRTTAGSRRYLDHVPDEDAESWVKLRNAGAILLGKQETHEFAIGGPDFTLPFEPARNPWNTAHYPAGSSSGSAVAVAAGLCAAAMGSDTGGSIRGPAAYCGIVGLKPTYGRVSRRGVFPLSYTLDHCGPLTRTVEDCAIMMQALAGYDPQDPASADVPVPDYRAALAPRLDGLTIGVVRHFHEKDAVADFGADSTPSAAYGVAFDNACRTLESLGARLVDRQLSPLIDYVDANRLIMIAEAYALHEKDFQTRPQDFGHHMFARIALGAFLSASDYVEALRQRRELCLEFARALDGVDVIVSANSTGPAPRIDSLPTFGTVERASYTGPYNLTGSPALSVPIGFEDGFPLA